MATINVERRSTIGLTILTVDSLILFMLFMSKFIFNDPVQWMDPHPTSIIWIWLSLRIIPLLVIKAISTSPSSSTINISISWAFPGRYLIIAWCIQILDFIVLAIYIFINVYARDDPKTPMYLLGTPTHVPTMYTTATAIYVFLTSIYGLTWHCHIQGL